MPWDVVLAVPLALATFVLLWVMICEPWNDPRYNEALRKRRAGRNT